MKKVFLTLILTIGAVLIFTSCTKKQKIKTDRFDDQTINMSYQALSSIKMLETKEEYTTVKRLSNRVANQEVVEKEVIDKYLGLMQELLNDNGGFKTETKVSDKPEYSNLVEMNNLLKRSGKSFYELIKDLNVDSQLFEFIVSNLDYFKDVSTYDGEEVLFYKRAQLLTSDILHVREKKEQIDVDYSHLIGCADYKIPQVMRCYGMLEFSESLADRVDNKVKLEEGSKEEVEIRSNTLKVIDYIYEKLDRKYSRMDINDFIWLLGQDKSKMTKPYHRTLTKHY